MLCYKSSCTSAELEFEVAGVHTSKKVGGQKSKVKLSTSAKHGFWFWGHPQVLISDGNQA